jgi:alpha-beta hydrolase superfamily lysophospholipase
MQRELIQSNSGTKVPIHFGVHGRPLFGFYHPPETAGAEWRDVAVVLCNPLGSDHTRSERTYRHLAERLAAAGFPTIRFDFFGTGDSGGDELEAGLVQAWIEDVGAAVAEARARSGATKVALVGLRLGATLALLYSSTPSVSEGVDSLVLWSPCVSGGAFVSEITKLHKVYARIEPHLAGAPPPRGDGEEALGLFLTRSAIADLSRIDLLETFRAPARRVLVIDGGNVSGKDALVQRLRDTGAECELRSHPGHKFLMTVSHRGLVPDEVLGSIQGWLQDAYPKTAGYSPPSPRLTATAPFGERPLIFGEDHPLFGILTPAAAGRARPGRPPIIMTNAGCVNRTGPHRTYVKMARRWATLGFDVLRVDLSGIGDSPVAAGTPENLTYPSAGMDDLLQAISALGDHRAIVVGLCSGGDYAFQLGARSSKIAGAWMLNPRTFCVLDLAQVESSDGSPPTTSVEEVPRMLRAMAERGVDALLVVSRSDPGVAYVDVHATDAMQGLESAAGFERVDLDGSDHTFTPVGTQERVSDLLTEHLTTRYGGPLERGGK